MSNANAIEENMLKANKIIREMRIIMNKRDNELHSKYADLLEMQYVLSDITKLTHIDFSEYVLTRTLIMAEISTLEEMYNSRIREMKCELAILDGAFQNLSEQCF